MSNGAAPQQNSTDLAKALQQAQAELTGLDPHPFSSQAFATLQEKITKYVAQLVDESAKVAKRHRADTISEAHVQTASDYLISDTSRRFFRHLGTLGGILLGAALSNLLSMSSANKYPPLAVLLTTALGIIGAFLIAFHIARD